MGSVHKLLIGILSLKFKEKQFRYAKGTNIEKEIRFYLSPLLSLFNSSSFVSSFSGTKFGVWPPENISNRVTPKDQTSDENEYFAYPSTSGAYLK